MTACSEKLCREAGGKEGEASGIVALEGVGDEDILAGQGGMAESNRNPDEVVIKKLRHVLLVSNNHIIIIKGHGQL